MKCRAVLSSLGLCSSRDRDQPWCLVLNGPYLQEQLLWALHSTGTAAPLLCCSFPHMRSSRGFYGFHLLMLRKG